MLHKNSEEMSVSLDITGCRLFIKSNYPLLVQKSYFICGLTHLSDISGELSTSCDPVPELPLTPFNILVFTFSQVHDIGICIYKKTSWSFLAEGRISVLTFTFEIFLLLVCRSLQGHLKLTVCPSGHFYLGLKETY